MDAVGDIFSALAELFISLLELLFYGVENLVCGVLWLFRCSKFAGPRRKRKLPEETRWLIRSCMHTTLALGLLFVVLYFGLMRKPAQVPPSQVTSPPQPTKIEKARDVFEKARRIKETLLPPKNQP